MTAPRDHWEIDEPTRTEIEKRFAETETAPLFDEEEARDGDALPSQR